MSKIQILSRLPAAVTKADLPAPLRRILEDHLGLIAPESWTMPGTRIFQDWRAVHFAMNAGAQDIKWLFDTINDAGVLDWRIEAGQDFKLERDPETGEVVGGVYIPVPTAMVNWLADIIIYDEDGNPIGTERPVAGAPMHIYAGADQWVWA